MTGRKVLVDGVSCSTPVTETYKGLGAVYSEAGELLAVAEVGSAGRSLFSIRPVRVIGTV